MSDEVLQLDPERSALIIQDLQNDVIIEGGAFADSGAPAHATAQNVVGNVADLAAACRAAGVPVIHVWYIVEPGAPGLKQNAPLFQGVKEANALVRGSLGRGAGRGPRAPGRRPRRREDAHERLLRDAPGHPPARPGGRAADHHRRLDEHVDRAHRAPRRRRRLRGRRRLRRHVDHRRGVAERGAELRDDQRGEGRHLRGDQERPSDRERAAERPRPAPGLHRRRAGSTPTPARPSPSPTRPPGEVVAEVPRMGAPRRGARSRPRSARCRAGAGCWPRSARRSCAAGPT